ncbi:WW domain-containing protein, partial [Striga asiatica]
MEKKLEGSHSSPSSKFSAGKSSAIFCSGMFFPWAYGKAELGRSKQEWGRKEPSVTRVQVRSPSILEGSERVSNSPDQIIKSQEDLTNTKVSGQQSITSSAVKEPVIECPTNTDKPLTEDNLVDVEIQPSSKGENIGQRKKTTFTRRPRISKGNTSDSMHIDSSERVETSKGNKGKGKRS